MIAQTDDRTNQRKVGSLDELLLGLGLAAAVFVGGLVYVLKNAAQWTPVNDSTYLALRSAYRVVDFLRLKSVRPVATSVLRRQAPFDSERFGIEIFVVLTLLSVAAAVTLLLHLFAYSRIYIVLVRRSTLGVLLFATPVSYLVVSWLTCSWPQGEPWILPHGSFFLQSLPLMVFASEIACLCALAFFLRPTVTPKLPTILFISVHFSFWILVFWRETQIWLFHIYSSDFVLLLIFSLPFVYVVQHGSGLEQTRNDQTTRWIAGLGIASLILLGAMWAPAKTVALSHPKDLSAVRIELARGPCFGACPIYTVTLHGDGQVEYVGRQGHSRFETRKQGRVEREKVIEILQTLDQVDFMTLEDRAFSWGFDSPSVGVRVWEDGKTKRVASDEDFVGSKDGRQSRFVQAAQKIDGVLRSTQWTQCQGEECANASSMETAPN